MPEETNSTPETDDAATAPVNDIAPPPAPTPTTEPNVVTVKKETAPIDESLPAVKKAPATSDPVASDVADPKSAMQPKNPILGQDANTNKAAETKPEHTEPLEPIVAHSAQTHHEHRNNKKFAAILVIVIALLLAGGAVFVYSSAQDNAQESTAEQAETTQDQNLDNSVDPANIPATPDTIDQTLEDVDQTLESLDDDSDFMDDQLSDETLGL